MLSMELQLGLALPVCSPIIKGFDLNERRFEPDHDNDYSFPIISKSSKRSFDEAFGKNVDGNEASHFLVWDGHPNEEDDRKGHKKTHSHPINKSDSDEESYIVGWPPIKSSRKKDLLQNNGGHVDHHHQTIKNKRPLMLMAKKNIVINGYNSSSAMLINNNNNPTYVKVKMEGVAIARKIDLSLHHSYHSLKNALITMFTKDDGKCAAEDSESYTLTYQDKDGDWLLAGDVPWKSFINSVQRLEIVRNGG